MYQFQLIDLRQRNMIFPKLRNLISVSEQKVTLVGEFGDIWVTIESFPVTPLLPNEKFSKQNIHKVNLILCIEFENFR